MATLTIRDLDDTPKQSLRIRARFAGLDDVSLPISDRADREPVRPPPPFEADLAVRRPDRRHRAVPLCRGAGLATRKVFDFEGCGLAVDNPWNHGA